MRNVSASLVGLVLIAGCGLDGHVIFEDDGAGGGGGAGGSGGEDAGPPAVSSQLDILFVIDNSAGMAAKQQKLAAAMEPLLDALMRPPCVDGSGSAVSPPVPPPAECPAGTSRAYPAVESLHIGVISSSLGDLTSGACENVSGERVGTNDRARLLDRGLAGPVETLPGNFIGFDHGQTYADDFQTFSQKARDLVVGPGETGCGFEMPLEAMTRFLADPAPYDHLVEENNRLVEVGVDEVILEQRMAFLRPTSNVAIVMLTDENDCSMNVRDQGFLIFGGPFYRATSACEIDPEDECCTSCGLNHAPECDPGGACEAPKYDALDDPPNLKCFDQKHRYGVDFQYPVERYVNALSRQYVDPIQTDLEGEAVVNGLFSGGRRPEQVTLVSIAGVPWQDLVNNPLDGESPYLSASQLTEQDRWSWFSADSAEDPFMQESRDPRNGTNPATGADVAANNPINGGDRTNPLGDDLQYACTFQLSAPVAGSRSCDECLDASCDDPQCDLTTQVASAAYPATRILELASRLSDRAVTTSVCRPPVDDYAVRAIHQRILTLLPD